MRYKWYGAATPPLLLLLLSLSCIHFAALYVFTKGFITTRIELPHQSQCNELNSTSFRLQQASQHGLANCSTAIACWSTSPNPQPSRINKVVLMIIDALRADFYYEPAANSSAAAAIIRNYNLHMPRLHGLMQQAGPAAFVAPFIADTPTITLSRLKALLTGSLPTFLDVGSSFSAAALTEDNLLDQMKKRGKRMVFAGDDTWMQLAPAGVFDAAHPYPSFNVHDLHTVDNGVWQYLNHYLDEPQSWDMLVGHYLGMDHAGHSRGVASSGMALKLAQMDGEVHEIARRLFLEAHPGGAYEHTLLIILGDHGQTLGGDHGGSSAEETDSLIAAVNVGKWRRQEEQGQRTQLRGEDSHQTEQQQQQQQQEGEQGQHSKQQQEGEQGQHSKQQQTGGELINNDDDEQQQQQLKHQLRATSGVGNQFTSKTQEPPQASDITAHPQMSDVAHTMSQLDFTSTLALLLGLPIPYGNVGSVDAQMWAAAWDGHGPGARSGSGQMGEVNRQERPLEETGGSAGLSELGWRHSYLEALALTSLQVHRYLETYTQVSSLAPHELEACNKLHTQAHTAYQAYLVQHQQLHHHHQHLPGEHYQEWPGGSGEQREEAEQPGHLHKEELLEVLHADALAKLLAFQQGAAELARSKFGGSNLPAMAFGCSMMLASMVLHLLLLARFGKATCHVIRGASVKALCAFFTTHLDTAVVPVGAVVFQAVSLFGLNWMMGEGRVLCTMLVVLQVFLATSAVRASVLRCKKGSNEVQQLQHPQQQGQADQLGRQAGKPQQHGTVLSKTVRTACVPFTVGCLAVGASVCMAWVGLIDRWGHDPHDKAQVSSTLEDLLGPTSVDMTAVAQPSHVHPAAAEAAAAAAAGSESREQTEPSSKSEGSGFVGLDAVQLLRLAAPAVGPLLSLPWLLWWATHWVSHTALSMLCDPAGCTEVEAAVVGKSGAHTQPCTSKDAGQPDAAQANAAVDPEWQQRQRQQRGQIASPSRLPCTPRTSSSFALACHCNSMQHTLATAAAAASAAVCGTQIVCCALWWLCQLSDTQDAPLPSVTRTAASQLHVALHNALTDVSSAASASGLVLKPLLKLSQPLLRSLVQLFQCQLPPDHLQLSRLQPSGWTAAACLMLLVVLPVEVAALVAWYQSIKAIMFQRTLRQVTRRRSKELGMALSKQAGYSQPPHKPDTTATLRQKVVQAVLVGALPVALVAVLAPGLSAQLLPPHSFLYTHLWTPAAHVTSHCLPSLPSISFRAQHLLASLPLLPTLSHAWSSATELPVRLLLPRCVYAIAAVMVAVLVLLARLLAQQQRCRLRQEGNSQVSTDMGSTAALANNKGDEAAMESSSSNALSSTIQSLTSQSAELDQQACELGSADWEGAARVVLLHCMVSVMVAPVMLLLGSRGSLVVCAATVAVLGLLVAQHFSCASANSEPPVLQDPSSGVACECTNAGVRKVSPSHGEAAVGAKHQAAQSIINEGDQRDGALEPSNNKGVKLGKDGEGGIGIKASCRKDEEQQQQGQNHPSLMEEQHQSRQQQQGKQVIKLSRQQTSQHHGSHPLVVRALPRTIGGACTLHVMGAAAFFASGHFCEFTGLQYASPFIGFDEMDWRVSPVLMTLNTFGLQLVVALCVGLLPTVLVSGLRAGGPRGTSFRYKHYQQLVYVGLLTLLSVRALVSLLVVACASVLHNHILVWAIIAPRFVFEICMAAEAAVAALIVLLMLS